MKKNSFMGSSVNVESFYNADAVSLGLEIVSGEAGIAKNITEAAINRPGLALTGFYDHFANRRIQVLGLAEMEYLNSLNKVDRDKSLERFFNSKIPCVVITRGKKVPEAMLRLSESLKIPVLRSKMITKHFVNAATIIMENLKAPRMKIQGTMVEIMGIGILIDGVPGIGKSETALALIRKGAALISDDITSLRLDSAGSLIGSPVSVTRYHMEIRGLGIIHVPSLFGIAAIRGAKKVDLVVTLTRSQALIREARGQEKNMTKEILGKDIPHIVIPVKAGRDVANVVETAALNIKLRRLGHDAAKELDEKLIEVLSGGQDVSE